jgi:hypothetical protein
MPVEIHSGDTINRVLKPRWQAQRDEQQLNGIIYSKGSQEQGFTDYVSYVMSLSHSLTGNNVASTYLYR